METLVVTNELLESFGLTQKQFDIMIRFFGNCKLGDIKDYYIGSTIENYNEISLARLIRRYKELKSISARNERIFDYFLYLEDTGKYKITFDNVYCKMVFKLKRGLNHIAELSSELKKIQDGFDLRIDVTHAQADGNEIELTIQVKKR